MYNQLNAMVKLNPDQENSIKVIDKFIQLFLYIQIPQTSLDYFQGGTGQAKKKEKDEKKKGENQEIISLSLDVIKQTLDLLIGVKPNDPDLQIMKMILFDLVKLLTGYDLIKKEGVGIQKIAKEDRLKILAKIIDFAIIDKMKIIEYMNCSIILKIIDCVKRLSMEPIKSVSNKNFTNGVIDLLYLLTGQPLPEKKQEQ